MEITVETNSYNNRRYGRPWIATVDFNTPKGAFYFGEFVGKHGDDGLLVITVDCGSIIAQGQKDNRGKNTSCDYFLVTADGELDKFYGGKAAAYQHHKDNNAATVESPLAKFSTGELIAEVERRKE